MKTKIAEDLLQKYWGLQAESVKKLEGEVSFNYRILCGGKLYIFKDAPATVEAMALAREEMQVIEGLSVRIPGYFQEPVRTLDGSFRTPLWD